MKKTAWEIELNALKDRVEGLMPLCTEEPSEATKGYTRAIRDVMDILKQEIREAREAQWRKPERGVRLYNRDDDRGDDR